MRTAAPKPHKYRAKPTRSLLTGRKYHSKREAQYADRFEQDKRDKRILDYLEQVPVVLLEGAPDRKPVVWRCDFVVIRLDGTVRFVEVKGFDTKEWKLKLKMLQQNRPEIALRMEVIR